MARRTGVDGFGTEVPSTTMRLAQFSGMFSAHHFLNALRRAIAFLSKNGRAEIAAHLYSLVSHTGWLLYSSAVIVKTENF